MTISLLSTYRGGGVDEVFGCRSIPYLAIRLVWLVVFVGENGVPKHVPNETRKAWHLGHFSGVSRQLDDGAILTYNPRFARRSQRYLAGACSSHPVSGVFAPML